MPNYEDLYKNMAVGEKELKDKLNNQQKLFKSLSKSLAKGDLKGWNKDLVAMRDHMKEQEILLEGMQKQVDEFGIRAYVENGDFVEQMLDYCARLEVDVKGEYPMYEMFPFRVRIDSENLDLYLDRKRVQCLRPLALVQDVKAAQDKLLKAAFDPGGFIKELAVAYDLTLLKQQHQTQTAVTKVGDIYLKSLYTLLTPMRRFRKEYDLQSFAFDLARLYASELRATEDGRQFQFGPSRNINKAIRILDKDGKEQYLATIRFFE
ncbi:MAG: hypothetical protein M0Z55_04545 [Peptococcaceae bacterium]|nr:hypothetical protein [Peptococcaceae bacterium]